MDYRPIAWMLLTNSPAYLVALAGIGIALVMARRHPQVSLLAGLSFFLSLANSLVSIYLSVTAPRLIAGVGPADFGRVMFFRGLASSAVSALAAGLLIAAVFGWRQAARSPQDG